MNAHFTITDECTCTFNIFDFFNVPMWCYSKFSFPGYGVIIVFQLFLTFSIVHFFIFWG